MPQMPPEYALGPPQAPPPSNPTIWEQLGGLLSRVKAGGEQHRQSILQNLSPEQASILEFAMGMSGGLRPSLGPFLPKQVQRIEEAGTAAKSAEELVRKPHGAYTTPADVTSPHLDLGGPRTTYNVNSQANVLRVNSEGAFRSVRGLQGISGGAATVERFMGREFMEQLINAPKSEAARRLSELYPKVDWMRYYDAVEMADGLGAMLAREHGYDAIYAIDAVAPEFTEYIGLTDGAFLR